MTLPDRTPRYILFRTKLAELNNYLTRRRLNLVTGASFIQANYKYYFNEDYKIFVFCKFCGAESFKEKNLRYNEVTLYKAYTNCNCPYTEYLKNMKNKKYEFKANDYFYFMYLLNKDYESIICKRLGKNRVEKIEQFIALGNLETDTNKLKGGFI